MPSETPTSFFVEVSHIPDFHGDSAKPFFSVFSFSFSFFEPYHYIVLHLSPPPSTMRIAGGIFMFFDTLPFFFLF